MIIGRVLPRITFCSNDVEPVLTPKLVSQPVATNAVEHSGDFFSRQELDILKLKLLDIPQCRLIDSNSVRGMCLANKPIGILEELKDAGIQTVIDLRKEGSYESKYARNCEHFGLNYFNFKIKDNMAPFSSPFSVRHSSREFDVIMDDFTKQLGYFFRLMQEGRVYMGCLLGLHRTDLAVVLNYLLNPKEPQSPPILSHMFLKDETNFTNKRIGSVKTLLKNLRPEHRAELHLPDNIGEILDARILKLRLMNLAK